MMRSKIDMSDGALSACVSMAEGNPGAANVITKLMIDDGAAGFMKILGLDDMNIRGTQIWVGYKDHCGQDLEAFKTAIHERDPAMVETINKECHHPELVKEHGEAYSHRAVTDGASFTRG